MRQTCTGTTAMDLYMLIRSSLIKSDTNGVYLEIFGRGCGQWTANRLWPKDCKRVFYDYFGHVLFLSVFPRRQSIMYNQPPPSCEIETMFTGLASRIITISYNWSLLNRLLLWKWLQIAKLCHWPLKKIVIVIEWLFHVYNPLSTIALQFNPLPTYSTIVGVNSD